MLTYGMGNRLGTDEVRHSDLCIVSIFEPHRGFTYFENRSKSTKRQTLKLKQKKSLATYQIHNIRSQKSLIAMASRPQ